MHNNRFWIVLCRFRKINFFHILGQGTSLMKSQKIEAPDGTSLIKSLRANFWTMVFDLLNFFESYWKNSFRKKKFGKIHWPGSNFRPCARILAVCTLFGQWRARARAAIWRCSDFHSKISIFPYGASILLKSFMWPPNCEQIDHAGFDFGIKNMIWARLRSLLAKKWFRASFWGHSIHCSVNNHHLGFSRIPPWADATASLHDYWKNSVPNVILMITERTVYQMSY